MLRWNWIALLRIRNVWLKLQMFVVLFCSWTQSDNFRVGCTQIIWAISLFSPFLHILQNCSWLILLLVSCCGVSLSDPCTHPCDYLSLNSERSEMWIWILKNHQHLIFSRAMAPFSSLWPSGFNPSLPHWDTSAGTPLPPPPPIPLSSTLSPWRCFEWNLGQGRLFFLSKRAVKLPELH